MQASVVAANPTATTLAVTCATSCILPSPFTITEGPSTFTLSAVYTISTQGVQEKITLVEDCAITGSTQGASCSVSYGVEATYKGVSTSTSYATVTQIPASEIFYEAIEVTGGVDKLDSSASSTETGTGTATATGAATGATTGATTGTATGTATGTGGASASGTGAVAVAEGAAGRGVVVGGKGLWGMVVGVVSVGMGMVLL
ncbi:hypothetical protein BO94DRAFT_477881 [Aspergillus sclerotioniger CBS 115572]|uniref:GPI anchored cell wall protein n=1 Tax=Aspergillus sclerotioniger CBS 115572 TaxID=1450535 RepID=A0A317V7E7_9EURO|nr:hypothetical protein BO94DRAFT_477881 [Aspergillus sclerotioniger CBS 115572]PWY69191.1 hypothetical protein BO94DRAFT_477881 [Aspergillus sclerotioniger CBS 115572]